MVPAMQRSKSKLPAEAEIKQPGPTVVGMGLIALDIVLTETREDPPRSWAGGTCGNVLVALSYLNWRAQPIARLRPGPAAERLLADLRKWGVLDRWISLRDDGSTPVIIERITRRRDGIPRHSFSWRCPSCGKPFPGFKPVLISTAEEIVTEIGAPQVFFFDRATPGAIVVARASAKAGALVVFEPSGIGNPVTFRQAWEAAHVVKYSHERLSELPEVVSDSGPFVQIETMGEGGLRYRRRGPRTKAARWEHLEAFHVDDLRDSSGAGDWCTAGFLSQAGTGGVKGFIEMNQGDMRAALRFGQSLAAWTCGYEGARGGMYAVDQRAFADEVQEILQSGVDSALRLAPTSRGRHPTVRSICTACGDADEVKLQRTRKRPA
jgi:sugar/nucleoside kinase (ribokinase family)